MFDRSPRLRWMMPVVVGAVLIGGGAGITAVTASADPAALTPRTAAQLLVDVRQAELGSLSGTIVQRSDLGIPELPGIGGASSSELTSLISGTHTLRVWYDGADKARLALLGTLGETDLIKNGADLWTWSSRDNSATHRSLTTSSTVPGRAGSGTSSLPSAALPSAVLPTADLPSTPKDAAAAVLSALDPSTRVSADANQTVAGRPVYQLLLQPKDDSSLISRITIAIDAVQHLPLRVQVFAASQPADPAFEVAFTAVDFSAPDPAQFTFNPPPGAQITQVPAETMPTAEPGGPAVDAGRGPTADAGRGPAAAVDPRVVGTGWTSVLIAQSPSQPGDPGSAPATVAGALAPILQSLPAVSGSWGSGHLLSGKIFSVVVADDGRVAVGAVAPEKLYAALAQK